MLTELDAHVFDSPLVRRDDRPDHWTRSLARITERNAHRQVVIEEDRRGRGAMRSLAEAPLDGISYDRRQGNVRIMLGDGSALGGRRTVILDEVQSVESLVAASGRDVALRIAMPQGQVLITFISADPDPAGSR